MAQQGGHRMGIYFNPNHTDFYNAVRPCLKNKTCIKNLKMIK